MRHRQRKRIVTGLLTALLAGAVGCDTQPSSPATENDGTASPAPGSTLPGLPSPDRARALLDGLAVAEPGSMAGYSRDKFPHWSSSDGCTTRQTVLLRDGSEVRTDDDCQPVSGTWHSAFDDTVLRDASEVDIDHLVPLANAWRSGADTWAPERREQFANDLRHPQLIAVSARSNREKGDQSPDQWQPIRGFWCAYALAWTGTKHAYDLTVTQDERNTLTKMVDTCPA